MIVSWSAGRQRRIAAVKVVVPVGVRGGRAQWDSSVAGVVPQRDVAESAGQQQRRQDGHLSGPNDQDSTALRVTTEAMQVRQRRRGQSNSSPLLTGYHG